MEGLKISKAGMMDLLEEAHTALANLQEAWLACKEPPADSGYSHMDEAGKSSFSYTRDNLDIRLQVQHDNDMLYGLINLDGWIRIEVELADIYDDEIEHMVPVLFWRLYDALAKEATE